MNGVNIEQIDVLKKKIVGMENGMKNPTREWWRQPPNSYYREMTIVSTVESNRVKRVRVPKEMSIWNPKVFGDIQTIKWNPLLRPHPTLVVEQHTVVVDNAP